MMELAVAATEAEPIRCRLCGGPVSHRFSGRILGKYTIAYWHCGDCGSLQTDPPYWLGESYASVLPVLDTGMAARTLQMAQITSLLLRLAGVGPRTACIDWGGGNGLFCRFLRDQGWNFLNYDKYAEPFYSAGFDADPAQLSKCDVITSFEVFEHLPDPEAGLAEILALQPRLWIFSTQLYRSQGPEWSYLAPAFGRHVFFYSDEALRDFAGRHGFLFLRGRHLHMFLRRDGNLYLRRESEKRIAHAVLRGGKLAALAATAHFLARQRRAHLRWQADRDLLGLRGEF